ncbi:MAG: hypothetical protein KatS3mg104_2014 [Phycisphaerae bacterium]|nr:MAG: hypothetical protein KatS3mg104_2014 [Phycisphaerae bacterium]
MNRSIIRFFAFPDQVVPQSQGRWWVMQAGETFVAVRSIGEPAVLGENRPDR